MSTKPYNVEIFDRSITLRSHYEIDSLDYAVDYLDPESNSVKLPVSVAVEITDYIWIRRGTEKVFGVVSGVSDNESGMRDVKFADFASMFDIDIMVNVEELGQTALENYVAEQVSKVYITNSDLQQLIPGLSVRAVPSVADWTLDIEPETDETSNAIVKLFDDVILPAFQGYEVVVNAEPDIMAKKILLTVSVNNSAAVTIEAELENILAKEIAVRKVSKEINKLTVYNKKDFDYCAVYYLHQDGSFDETDADRCTPVSYKITTVSTKTAEDFQESQEKKFTNGISRIGRIQKKEDPLDDDDIEHVQEAVAALNEVPGLTLTIGADGKVVNWNEETVQAAVDAYIADYQFEADCRQMAQDAFKEKADAKAESTFASNRYDNLIELEVAKDDTLVKPDSFEIGQRTNVIHDGVVYATALTGKKVTAETVQLIFGDIRLELTKILKGRAGHK